NGELIQRLAVAGGSWGRAWIGGSVFGDLGFATSTLVNITSLNDSTARARGERSSGLGDAGVGLVVRSRLYDRDVHLPFDVPVFVSRCKLAGGKLGRSTALSLRWVISTGELW